MGRANSLSVVQNHPARRVSGFFVGAVVFLSIATSVALGQSFPLPDWAVPFRGANNDSPGGLAIDHYGNVIMGVNFMTETYLPAEFGLQTFVSVGETDFLLIKFTPEGDILWVNKFGSANNDMVRGLAVDSENNILITGNFRGNVDFDPDPDQSLVLSSVGFSDDIFLVKYDPDGALIWGHTFGTTSQNHPYAIAVDKDDNVIITGHFKGTLDFNPDPDVQNTITSQFFIIDVFLAKFTPDGAYLWAHALGDGRGDGLATDSQGNVILSGPVWGTSDFDPGEGTAVVTSMGSSDLYIAKYTPEGEFIWVKQIGGNGEEYSGGVAVDSADNILFTGSHGTSFEAEVNGESTTFGGLGSSKCFTGKLDSEGNILWIHTLPGFAANFFSRGLGIAVNAADHAVVGGLFGPNSAQIEIADSTYSATGFRDPFVLRYDSEGQMVWHMVMTCPNTGNVSRVATDGGQALALAGTYSGEFVYAPALSLPAHPGSTASDVHLLLFTDDVAPPAPCHPAFDLNQDGYVNYPDLMMLLNQMGCQGPCAADLNADGIVNLEDFNLMMAHWGQACP